MHIHASLQKYACKSFDPSKMTKNKSRKEWLRVRSEQVKLLPEKKRYRPQRIAADGQTSREEANFQHLDLYPNASEETFFTKPMLKETSAKPLNTKAKNIGGCETSAKAKFTKNVRKFIVDSGASFHLISMEDLSKEERKTIRKRSKPIGVANSQRNCTRNSRSRRLYC